MNNIQNLETVLDLSERLRLLVASSLANLRQAELAATDSQQLKAEIAALVEDFNATYDYDIVQVVKPFLDKLLQLSAV